MALESGKTVDKTRFPPPQVWCRLRCTQRLYGCSTRFIKLDRRRRPDRPLDPRACMFQRAPRASEGRMLSGLLVLVACGGMGCTEPTDPLPAKPLDLTITTSGECARVTFEITGSSSVTTTYPSPGCTVGLVVIKSAATSTWDGTTRTLTLKTKVVNTSGQPVDLPVRLELPADGKTVLLPAGTSGDSLVPLNMDSTLANDRTLWLFGETGTLAPGDSTDGRFLMFQIKVPVTKARFWFVSSGEEIPTVPAVAPDSSPSWLAADSAFTDEIAKNALAVKFSPNATVVEKSAALDSVGGVVVGGDQVFGGFDGPYIVWVPATDLDSLFAFVAVLKRQPKVVRVNTIPRARDNGRRPIDDAAWGAASWRLAADSVKGSNWAVKEIAGPQAWGCSVGDSMTAIGVVDHGFVSDDFAPNLVNSLPGPTAANHGRLTTNVLAARGDNGVGMAGVMWKAKLRVYDRVDLGRGGPKELARAIEHAILDGASVVTVTAGAAFYSDTIRQRSAAEAFRDAIADRISAWIAAGNSPPLLVIAAGNDRQPADLTGPPWLVDSFPGNVLVVGASTPAVSGARHRWGYQGSGRGDGAGSNHGPSVQIYAPGEGVQIWEAAGGGGSFASYNGTSNATPAVAGIAGLIWALDPTLTAAEVKQYLIDGALQGNRRVVEESNRYVANAYESLKFAAEKHGVPICGNEVGFDDQFRLVVVRAPGDSEVVAPAGEVTDVVSGAQGGRLIAGSAWNGSQYVVRYYSLQNGTWQQTGTAPAGTYAVQFLERDTAYIKTSQQMYLALPGPLTLSIVGPGGPIVQDLDLGTRVGNSGGIFEVLTVSPEAEWVGFRSVNQTGSYYYADSLAGGVLSLLHADLFPTQNCVSPGSLCVGISWGASGAVWTLDTRWLGVSVNTYNIDCPVGVGCTYTSDARILAFDVPTRQTQGALISGIVISPPVASGDRTTWRECQHGDDNSFTTVVRTISTLQVVNSQAGCAQGPAVIPNAPIALSPAWQSPRDGASRAMSAPLRPSTRVNLNRPGIAGDSIP